MSLTKEQKQYIIDNYSTTKNTELLKNLPGISNRQMVNFATRKGLRKAKDFRQDLFTTFFTSEQDSLLKQVYPTYSKEEILKLFPDFKWTKIVRRAAKIGVKRNLSRVHKEYRTSRNEIKVQQKRKQTCLKKYNVEHPLQSDIIKQQMREKQIKSGKIQHILSNGETVHKFAKAKKLNASQVYRVYKNCGEEGMINYYENYEGSSKTTLEYSFEKLFTGNFEIDFERFNRFLESLNYKPDFKFSKEKKSLFVNVDGLYYHAEHKVDTKYHFKMRQDFVKNQQTIFQFREDELREKPEIVKSIILNYFGIYDEKYYARQCKIKKVSSKEAKVFFDENHLMGHYSASTYGLYCNDKLEMAVSVKRKKNGVDIARLCSKKNTTVVGGVSKLLKYIEKTYQPDFIQSFVDLRYATGHSYQKLGYKLENVTLGWKWTDFRNTYNRLKCRANMDERKLSQAEHAKELKWYKIYDAGQAKYVKILNSNFVESDCEDLYIKEKEEYYNEEEQGVQKQGRKSRRTPVKKGEKYNFWTVIEVPPRGLKVKCRCICGKEKMILKNHIIYGKSKSCGCMREELCTKTSFEKYGKKRASQTEEIKEKIKRSQNLK